MNKNNIFFTSDSHFNHFNIIKYSHRPFSNAEEMNEVLVKNWNKIIPINGVVYHLGDFFMSDHNAFSILSRLNGRIHLIKGNHEKTALNLSKEFESVRDYLELKVQDEEAPRGVQEIMMFHYPIASWNKQHHGSWHIHGHCHASHNKWKNVHMGEAKSLDVGVDSIARLLNYDLLPDNYRPISYKELKNYMDSKKGAVVDHHE
jgi:calcineurin-like phosphoesterase family protein